MTEEEEIMEAMSTTTTILLPQDIVMEILSRLPANSLVSSFKLVCKAWCTIIKDPDFIKMHLNRGGGAINGGGGRSRYTNNESIVRKDRYGNTLFQLHPTFNCEAKKMDIDSNLLILKSRLVGSCNGLLCLSVNELWDQSILLLNPSTRKYKVSPQELIQCLYGFISHRLATYGFGCYYNSTTGIDEYKVVRIAHFKYPQDQSFQIDIYSMSSNSWRRCREVKDMDCKQFQEGSGVFLNGVVHWMGSKHRNDAWHLSNDGALDTHTIVSFNIRDEEFGQVQMPLPSCADDVIVVDEDGKYPYIFKDDKITLMNVRGCLGMVYLRRTKMMDVELEIWVMKEYGVRESWTKEFVTRTSDMDPLWELPAGLYMFTRYMTCLLTGDDKILIEVRISAGSKDYGRRVLYDMNKKKIDGDLRMFDMPPEQYYKADDQVDYIETLVSLKSSNNRKRKDIESLRNQPFEDVLYFKQQLEGIIYF